MPPFKSQMIVFGLGLLGAACSGGLPDQKPFPSYAKGPDAAKTAPPVAVASNPALPIEVIARKAEISRVTLDRAMETMQQRLSYLKRVIIDAKADLASQSAHRDTSAQSAALAQAERQVRLGLMRARSSTADPSASWSEQASTINDLSGLIVSVSGLVNTIGDGEPVPGQPAVPGPTAQAGDAVQPLEPSPAKAPGPPPQKIIIDVVQPMSAPPAPAVTPPAPAAPGAPS